MDDSTRRQFLRMSGIAGTIGFTGCLENSSDERTPTPKRITPTPNSGSRIKDTDGDGVIDSEDYAPRDPEVQREEQVRENPTSTEEPSTETQAPEDQSDSGTVVLDDFEDTDQLSWDVTNGGRSSVEFTSDSVEGQHSIYFKDLDEDERTTIEKTLSNSVQPEEISFWFKYISSNNNSVKFHFYGRNDNKLIEIIEFNGKIEVKNYNQSGVATGTYVSGANSDQWYNVVLSDIDFSSNTLSVTVFDTEGSELGTQPEIDFWDDVDQLQRIGIADLLGWNGDPDPVWVDYITYTY